MHQIICQLADSQVRVIAAAGNSASDLAGTVPATYKEVLTTTSTNDLDGYEGSWNYAGAYAPSSSRTTSAFCGGDGGSDEYSSDYSNYAGQYADRNHTIALPGSCMKTTWFYNDYIYRSGTSFAAPLGTGLIALCDASGVCSPDARTAIGQVVTRAQDCNYADVNYGYNGDPFSQVGSRYVGWLGCAQNY